MAGYSPAGVLDPQGVNNYGLGNYTTVWQSWNTVTGGTQTADAWGYWNQGFLTGSITTVTVMNAATWQYWNQGLIYQQGQTHPTVATLPVDTRSEEQILADTAATKERARVFVEQQKREADERVAAVAKARATLKSVLSMAQQEQLDKHNSFELQVNERLYRVQPGRRVQRLNPTTKKVLSEFCIHPDNVNELPNDDIALSQKLLLEANEPEFLRLANETRMAA